MKDACRISANALVVAGKAVEPGVSTLEIDTIVRKYIEKEGATPSFLGYGGFPASACISVNNVVIHGIPSKKQILKEGDIVSVDVGAFYQFPNTGEQHPMNLPVCSGRARNARCSWLKGETEGLSSSL